MVEKQSCSCDLEGLRVEKVLFCSLYPHLPYPWNLLLQAPKERLFELLVQSQPEDQPLT